MESFRTFSSLELVRANACNRYIRMLHSNWNATTSNCRIMAKSHPAGMHICYATFAGISLRLCSISLRSFRITFAAYLPTHIKSLRDFFQSLLNNHRDNLYIISYFFGGAKKLPAQSLREKRKITLTNFLERNCTISTIPQIQIKCYRLLYYEKAY